MTDIEKKALALLNEVQMEMHGNPGWYEGCNRTNATPVEAVCRAIEQHEAYKQEVSDAVESLCNTVLMSHGHRAVREMLSRRFIIAKTDPLVEVLQEISGEGGYDNFDHYAYRLRSALEARGLEIREKQP